MDATGETDPPDTDEGGEGRGACDLAYGLSAAANDEDDDFAGAAAGGLSAAELGDALTTGPSTFLKKPRILF